MSLSKKTNRDRFRTALRRRGMTYADAAATLQCSVAMVGHIASGARTPGMDLAKRIYDNFGLPMSRWSAGSK